MTSAFRWRLVSLSKFLRDFASLFQLASFYSANRPETAECRKNSSSCRLFLLLGVMSALITSPVYAHKVNLFAYVEQGTVYTKSYFPDGKAVEGGKVEVYDSQENKLLEGTTDKEGLFSFPVPKEDNLNIVLIATMGHKNSYVLKKEELTGAVSEPQDKTTQQEVPPVKEQVASKAEVSPSLSAEDYRQLAFLIDRGEKNVSEEIRHLKYEIASLREEMKKPGLSEIFGGIGYVLGFLGIAFYMQTRKSGHKEK